MKFIEDHPFYQMAVPCLILLYIGVSPHTVVYDVALVVLVALVGIGGSTWLLGRVFNVRRVALLLCATLIVVLAGGFVSIGVFWLWVLILVGLWVAVPRIPDWAMAFVTAWLNISATLGTGMLVFKTAPLAGAILGTEVQVELAPPPILPADSATPNIWHIVLDGYGAPAWLDANFGCGHELPQGLAQRGFRVPQDTHANYGQTLLSMASLLNMSHIPEWYTGPSRNGVKRGILQSRVVAALAARGYAIQYFESEYTPVQLDAAERHAPWLAIGLYGISLLDLSALSPVLETFGQPPLRLGHALHRRSLNWTLDHFAEPGPGPTFRLVHLLAPHPPFVFEPDGSYRPDHSRSTIHDASQWRAMHEASADYSQGYCAKVDWLAPRLLAQIDRIVEREPDAVILVHGDHGPGSELDWEEGGNFDERLGALVAVRASPGVTEQLYDGMTLVNLYPVILDGTFGTDVPRRPDAVYWSTWLRPLTLIEITDRLDSRP